MYRVTKEFGAPPDLPEEVKRKDWFIGDATLADTKAYVSGGQYGSFLVRRKRIDGSAYTLFIQDREGKVKMYGIKWNAHVGKYVFGERYVGPLPFVDSDVTASIAVICGHVLLQRICCFTFCATRAMRAIYLVHVPRTSVSCCIYIFAHDAHTRLCIHKRTRP
jgi:hypothetical protein